MTRAASPPPRLRPWHRAARFFLWGVTVGAALWLVACRAAALVGPRDQPLLAFFPFTTALAFGVNGILLAAWTFRRRWLRALVPLLALVAAWSAAAPVFGVHWSRDVPHLGRETPLKVLLWNVHGLGIYDLPEDRRVPGKMLEFIRAQDADLVCLVEFYTDYNNAMKPHSRRFLKEGGFREFRFVWDNTLGDKIYVGIALFSRLKVSAVQERWLAKNINLLQADVQLRDGRPIRIVTLHLESFHLADDDKAALEATRDGSSLAHTWRMGKAFIRKSVVPFQKRAVQADSAAVLLGQSPYPLIVCGDLNDLPGSYAYTTVRGGLKDAFAERGQGFGRTYNRLAPTLRIDNIFFDPRQFRCLALETVPTTLSDHNPIIATFAVLPGSPAR